MCLTGLHLVLCEHLRLVLCEHLRLVLCGTCDGSSFCCRSSNSAVFSLLQLSSIMVSSSDQSSVSGLAWTSPNLMCFFDISVLDVFMMYHRGIVLAITFIARAHELKSTRPVIYIIFCKMLPKIFMFDLVKRGIWDKAFHRQSSLQN